MASEPLPDYEKLERRGGIPSSWEIWGDTLGALNLATPEKIVDAAGLIERGAVFALNWRLDLPDPPLFSRDPLVHEVRETPISADDHISGFNTQSSSQWDGFLHISHPAHGHYGGEANEASHGIDNWARRGLAGRGVLADVQRWRESLGRPIEHGTPELIPFAEVLATLEAQGTTVAPGDFLMIRFGWIDWYENLDQDGRKAQSNMASFACPGLEPGEETASGLWNLHVAAVAADNPSCESWPPGSNLPESERGGFWRDPEKIGSAFVHTLLLPMLGIPIGEMWALDALAADCAEDGRYECFLTSAPLNLPGGIASPPNALAIK